jgi:hypothetical protein
LTSSRPSAARINPTRGAEHECSVKRVVDHDSLEVSGRPTDVHDLQCDGCADDRSSRRACVGIGRDVFADHERDLCFRTQLRPVLRAVALAGHEQRAGREVADNRLAADDRFDSREVQAQLPPDPALATVQSCSPASKWCTQRGSDPWMHIAHRVTEAEPPAHD